MLKLQLKFTVTKTLSPSKTNPYGKNLPTCKGWKGFQQMSKVSNLSWVFVLIGKLPNLNIQYVKSADLTTKSFLLYCHKFSNSFLTMYNRRKKFLDNFDLIFRDSHYNIWSKKLIIKNLKVSHLTSIVTCSPWQIRINYIFMLFVNWLYLGY